MNDFLNQDDPYRTPAPAFCPRCEERDNQPSTKRRLVCALRTRTRRLRASICRSWPSVKFTMKVVGGSLVATIVLVLTMFGVASVATRGCADIRVPVTINGTTHTYTVAACGEEITKLLDAADGDHADHGQIAVDPDAVACYE